MSIGDKGKLNNQILCIDSLLSNLPGMVYRCYNNKLWTMEFVSEGCLELTGYMPAELVNNSEQPFYKLINPEDRERIWSEVQRPLSKNQPYKIEYRIVTKQGVEKWVWEQGRGVVSNRQGHITHLEGFITDITEKKRAEERVSFQASLLNHVRNAVIATDIDGKIIYWNDYARILYQWDFEEVAGKSIFDVTVPAESRDEAVEILGIMAETDYWEGELRVRRRDSSRFVSHVILTFIRDRSGYPTGIIGVSQDISERKMTEEELKLQRAYFHQLFANSPDAIVRLDNSDRVVDVNDSFEKIFQYKLYEVRGLQVNQLIVPENLMDEAEANSKEVMAGAVINKESLRMRKDGALVDVCIMSYPIMAEGKQVGLYAIYSDISERKRVEDAIREVVQGISASVGVEFFRLLVYHLAKALKVSYAFVGELPEGRDDVISTIAVYANGSMVDNFKYDLRGTPCEKVMEGHTCCYPSGVKGHFPQDSLLVEMGVDSYMGIPLLDSGKRALGLIAIMDNKPIKDIQFVESLFKIFAVRASAEIERKRAEDQLRFLSHFDPLTGLYNRVYFEKEMRYLDEERAFISGIIMCDVDGLKLVNDTLGHDKGDHLLIAAAGAIKKALRRDDIISRIGGDEFAVLMPGRTKDILEGACLRIRQAVDSYNAENCELPLSISIGFAVGNEATTSMNDIFKEADNNMYREKLHRSKSARSAIVQTLMKALEARDFITEGHADRLQELVVVIARAAGMSGQGIRDLQLLAQFHDIGKVGIPDRILFKPGPLTPDEFKDMQRHSEIGHRIAQSAPDLIPIADWILKHHEWWNGQGYPLGLKGEEIPLECRILSIADAYDAMTSERPYRKAMSPAAALQELKRCAGKQFDPVLIKMFVEAMEKDVGQ